VKRARLGAVLCAAAIGCAAIGCDAGAAPAPAPSARPPKEAAPEPRPRGFLKGQLHAHTNGSGDSDTPPAEAMAWYAAHGFDFVVVTDHNVVTEAPSPPGMLVLRGVELTQNLRTCDPPPDPGDACLLHVNALFVAPRADPVLWEVPSDLRRVHLYGRAVDRALALGGVAQLNHPNFQRGADAGVLVALARRGLALVEIANQAVDSGNEGDGRHLSTEAMWDVALASGARVWGTATDDAHHYEDAARARARGETAYVGDRAFVMVRADRTEAAIRAAVTAGDFYATTGVVLERLEVSPDAIDVAVRPSRPPYVFEVIADGRTTRTETGTAIHVDPRREGQGYVRVRITDASGRRAWTQPAMLR
jgi:hypothetical protein